MVGHGLTHQPWLINCPNSDWLSILPFQPYFFSLQLETNKNFVLFLLASQSSTISFVVGPNLITYFPFPHRIKIVCSENGLFVEFHQVPQNGKVERKVEKSGEEKKPKISVYIAPHRERMAGQKMVVPFYGQTQTVSFGLPAGSAIT